MGRGNEVKGKGNGSQTIGNYQWVIFALLTIVHLLMAMCFYAWGPLAPFLKKDLLINNNQFGFVVSIMYGVMVVVSIPGGFLTDKYGVKWMLVLSGFLLSIGFALFSVFNSYESLFLVSALAGAGYGMINQITAKGLMYWFEPSKRATIMGIKQTSVPVGGSLIGIYLPFFAKFMGWQRAIFLLAGAIFFILLISLVFYREKPDLDESFFKEQQKGKTEETSIKSVLLQSRVLSLIVIFTLLAIGQSCVTSFIVLYGRESFSLPMEIAGSFLTFAMVGGSICRVLFGFISDRIFKGDRVAPMALLTLLGVGTTLSLVFLNKGAPLWLLYAICTLLGGALLGWNSLAIVLMAEIAGNELVGSIMGIIFTIAWGGMVIGPTLFGYVVDMYGYKMAWLVIMFFTAISFMGLICLWQKQKKAVLA